MVFLLLSECKENGSFQVNLEYHHVSMLIKESATKSGKFMCHSIGKQRGSNSFFLCFLSLSGRGKLSFWPCKFAK